MWLPKKLELQMKVIEKNPDVGIVGTHCRYFGESTAIPKIPDNELYRADFVKMNPLIHSSILSDKPHPVWAQIVIKPFLVFLTGTMFILNM
jgi:hypothetical protein